MHQLLKVQNKLPNLIYFTSSILKMNEDASKFNLNLPEVWDVFEEAIKVSRNVKQLTPLEMGILVPTSIILCNYLTLLVTIPIITYSHCKVPSPMFLPHN